MMENIDKENFGSSGKIIVDTVPMRTPLQDVNFKKSTLKSTKIKACYSQITPVMVRTPTRTQLKMKPSLLAFRDKSSANNDDVAINSLVYKKVKEIIKQATEQFKTQLAEKDKLIQELTDKLSQESEAAEDMPSDTELQQFVDNTLSKCVSQIQNEQVHQVPEIHIHAATPNHRISENTQTKGSEQHTIAQKQTCLFCQKTADKICVQNVQGSGTEQNLEAQDLKDSSESQGKSDVCTCSAISENAVENGIKCQAAEQLSLSASESIYPTDSAGDVNLPLAQSENVVYSEAVIGAVSLNDKNNVQSSSNIKMANSENTCDSVDQGQIKISSCDTGLQCVSQSLEQACSPVLKWCDMVEKLNRDRQEDMCNTSVQCVTDKVEQACSPIVNQITLVDQSCSPEVSLKSAVSTMTTPCVTPAKVNIGTQIQTECVTVMCSPIQTQTLDRGTQVMTDQKEAGTMTGITTHNQETCMTPIKLQGKQGHRITAESIRKQHPRVLANKIDTMELENQRLLHEVTMSTKKQDTLRSQIKDLKSKLKEQQKTLESQEEKFEAEKEHTKGEYDRCIEELQNAEVASQDRICSLEAELESSKTEMQAEISQYTSQIAALTDKYQALETQIEELQTELHMKDNAHQLRSAHLLIQELQTDLSEYVDLADSLQTAEKLQSEMHLAVTENYKKVDEAAERLKILNTAVHTQAQQVNEQKKKNEEDLVSCEKIRVDSERKCKEMEFKVKSLLDAVEKYKQDVHNLETKLEYQVQEYDMIEKDLYEVREYAVEQSDKLQRLETENRESLKEQETTKCENFTLRDRCAVLQAKCQELKETLNYTQEELSATKEHAARLLSAQEDELCQSRFCIEDLRDKMSQVLMGLREKVGIQSMSGKEMLEMDSELSAAELNTKAETKHIESEDKSRSLPSSFLSEILQAVQDVGDQEHVSNPGNKETNSLESNSVSSQVTGDEYYSCGREIENTDCKLGTETEAIDLRVTKSDGNYQDDLQFKTSTQAFVNSDIPEPDTVTTGSGVEIRESSAFASVRGAGIQPRLGPLKPDCDAEASDDCEKTEDEWSLVDQLEALVISFTEIIRLAYILDKASRLSISDLKDTNEEISKQLVQSECLENRLQAELDRVREQHSGTLQQIKELENALKTKCEALSRQDDMVEELRMEVSSLQRDAKQLKHEKATLKSQLKAATHFSSDKTQMSSDSGIQNEIMTLKMKNQQLHEKLIQKNEYYEDIGSKAARRIKILEENWKKAESEVFRFDELVERIRRILLENDSVVHSSGLRQLLQIIDGKDKKESGHLQPVKTVKW